VYAAGALVATAVVLVVAFALREPAHSSRAAAAAAAGSTTRGDEHGAADLARDLGAPETAAPRSAVARATPSDGSTILDAAARARLRETIWGALGEELPDSGIERPPTAYVLPISVSDPPGANGRMEPEYIRDRVRNDFFPFARDCYAEALKTKGDLAGRIVLHFVIVGDSKIGGIVESVDVLDKSTLRDPTMIECIRESFLGTKFPPPENGGWVSVDYPISFSPDDDEAGD
jgi:hypothetical protein